MNESPGTSTRLGFVLVAIVDAVAALALGAGGNASVGTRVLVTAYAVGHVLLLGFLVGAIADLGNRLLPPRALLRAVAGWMIAIVLGVLVLAEDYGVFVPPVRVALTIGTALPYGVLAGAGALVVARRPLGAAALLLGVALPIVNGLVLGGAYHGIHLAITLAAGLLAGLGLRALAPRPVIAGARAHIAAWAMAAVFAAASIAIWPSNDVVVALSRRPTASVQAFWSHLRGGRPTGVAGAVAPDEAEWFTDRSHHPSVPPTFPPLHESPVVVFITVDALRADVVSDGGQKATRNLRAMGKEGAAFTQARSPASATSPSVGALFTGKYYSSLYWTPRKVGGGKVKYFMPEDPSPRWPELLSQRGVRRLMVRRRGGFDESGGLVRGFDEYTPEVRWADEIVDLVEKSLDAAGPGPLLVYTHMMDAHAPYSSRGKVKGGAFRGYLAEVAFVDKQIGRLRRMIEDKGLRDRTFLIVSADHGEAFGEHETKYHAATIYEELVRIPMMVVGPGIARRKITEPVSLVDLGPTILDLFGVATPGHFMGQSLVPLLRGERVQLTRPLALDTGRRKQGLVGRDGLKIIRNLREGTVELYDLRADPGELVNLVTREPALAEARLGTLASFFDAHELRREGYEIPSRD